MGERLKDEPTSCSRTDRWRKIRERLASEMGPRRLLPQQHPRANQELWLTSRCCRRRCSYSCAASQNLLT